MLVQLNKCVVCGSDLQRGHSGGGGLSSSILFKYECSMGHLFVRSWVRRVVGECCLRVMYFEWYGVCDFVVLSVAEVCADYGAVNVFHVCLNFGVVYGVWVCVNVCGVVCIYIHWIVCVYIHWILDFKYILLLNIYVCFLRLGVVCCDVM